MTDDLGAVLLSLAPRLADERPDWQDVLARAGRTGRTPRARRPRILVAAVMLCALVALLATPAFGVQSLVLHLLGRKNVSFANSGSAPNEVKKQFEDLAVGAPGSLAAQVIASQTRVVATFSIAGHPRRLWVAPTRRGGYCYTFELDFGGCRQTVADRGIGGKSQFRVTWQGGAPGSSLAEPVATRVGGDLTAPGAARITAAYADGTKADIPFVWVSRPISAGFFSYDIPVSHWTKRHRLLALTLYGGGGQILGRQTFPYVRPRPLKPPPVPPRITGPKDRRLSTRPSVPPSEPLQRGSADGFMVVAGRNGSVQFTELHATPILRRLVGLSAGFGCFRLTKEFGIFTVRDLSDGGRFAPEVGTKLSGVGTPFDGCEVQAPIGRTWPDALDDHAAVEIPLTVAGRRFFADRAAARDVALFVRSRRMHTLRKEPAPKARADIEATYGRELAHSRIRIALVDPRTLKVSEVSSTGRQFRVTIHNGRISSQNLRPYAFVF